MRLKRTSAHTTVMRERIWLRIVSRVAGDMEKEYVRARWGGGGRA